MVATAGDRHRRQGRMAPRTKVAVGGRSAWVRWVIWRWVRPAQVEDWRRGRVPYLEQVVVAGLPKISAAMRVFRSWAESAGLRPSETVYVSWTRDRRRLRFSMSGSPDIERAYRTHWLPLKPEANASRGGD